jgi:uncharacterized protein YkwD/peroxiredoxin
MKMHNSSNVPCVALSVRFIFISLLVSVGLVLSAHCGVQAQLATGQIAPAFALKDPEGRRHELAEVRDVDFVILYLCDLESASNLKGLERVNAFMESHRGSDIRGFAVTPSPAEHARAYVKEHALSFPLLVDDAGVVDSYHSHLILPTVYILRRGLIVSRVLLGGGRSMEIQLQKEWAETQSVPRSEISRTPTPPPAPIRKTVESPEDKARRLFHFAREENKKLVWDDCLTSKAVQRAKWLYETGTFEHRDPGSGTNPAFDMVKSCARNAAFAGENLSRSIGSSARTIHNEFMESSTHRENIENRRFSRMGVGCHETICVELFIGF